VGEGEVGEGEVGKGEVGEGEVGGLMQVAVLCHLATQQLRQLRHDYNAFWRLNPVRVERAQECVRECVHSCAYVRACVFARVSDCLQV
jgi:hypothetical protein